MAENKPKMNAPGEQVGTDSLRLARAPIVEAVVDIDCDMPPGFSLPKMEARAREAFADAYPKFRAQLVEEHQIQRAPDQPPGLRSTLAVGALQFLQDDERQLVQLRAAGFSFNRLTPYSSLDDYLPEIERTWALFVSVVEPIQIRKTGLRYINRILLPMRDGRIELGDYLKISPRLPDETRLMFRGFFNQHRAYEVKTGNHVNIILTTQKIQNNTLPLIFDIEAFYPGIADPSDWAPIQSRIRSLRSLKNHVFADTLTERCLNLFQH